MTIFDVPLFDDDFTNYYWVWINIFFLTIIIRFYIIENAKNRTSLLIIWYIYCVFYLFYFKIRIRLRDGAWDFCDFGIVDIEHTVKY
jgi:hypothetical protein